MNKLSFRDTAELIGLAAIVASLIFVGMELQQSQRIAIADQYPLRLQANLSFLQAAPEATYVATGNRFRRQLPDSDMPENVRLELSQLDPAELGVRVNLLRQALMIVDNSHYQYQNGFMGEESWRAIRARSVAALESGWLSRALVLERQDEWRESFVQEFREIHKKLDAGR